VVVVGWSRSVGKVHQFSGNVLDSAFRWVACLVTADIISPTCPDQLSSAALYIQPETPAQHLAAVDCVNERAMIKRYDPGQVTHPLDVAQSAAWIGGATGMYATVAVPPFPHFVFYCHFALYASTPGSLSW
jgi:hypothetical protein